MVITANELKIKGISVVESSLKDNDEVVISVRGERKYVVLDVNKYEELRDYELLAAVEEVQDDLQAKRYIVESAEDHIKRLKNAL